MAALAKLRASLRGGATDPNTSSVADASAGAKRGPEDGAREDGHGSPSAALAKKARATISGLFGALGGSKEQ